VSQMTRSMVEAQFEILDSLRQHDLTHEQVVAVTAGTAIGRLKAMPRKQARTLAVKLIVQLTRVIVPPDVEEG
jgi:hypothetical protein